MALADIFTPAHHNVSYGQVLSSVVLFNGETYKRPANSKVLEGSRVKLVKLPDNSGVMIKGELWKRI